VRLSLTHLFPAQGNDKPLDESQLAPPTLGDRPSAVRCNVIAVTQARLSDFAGCSLVGMQGRRREMGRVG